MLARHRTGLIVRSARKTSMQGQQNLLSWTIGMMDEERPVKLAGMVGERLAVFKKPFGIGLAQGFGPIGQHGFIAFQTEELRSALIGQRLLGGIQDLDQVATHALSGKTIQAFLEIFDGFEKIAYENTLGETAEMGLWRQAGLGRRGHMAICNLLDEALDDVSAEPSRRAAQKPHALTPSRQQLADGKKQDKRPSALGHLGQVTVKVH